MENRRVVLPLVLIGLAAGFFSALFGVGGGIIVVPLLLLLGKWQRAAGVATSLAAIGIIALAGDGLLRPARGPEAGSGRDRRAAGRGRRRRGHGAAATARQPPLSFLFALLLAGLGVKLLI